MTPDQEQQNNESLVPRGFKAEKLDASRKDGLSEWVISLDKDFIHNPETKSFLEKYNNLSFHVWGKIDEKNGETLQQAFKKCGVVLAAGLASNYRQWDAEDSFVSKLAGDLNDKTSWVGISVDLPGFGGSELVPGQESEENVSASEFTKLIQFAFNKFEVQEEEKENITLIGHSSGGEAVLPFSTEGYKVFAFNPALKAKLGLIFTGLSIGTSVGSKTMQYFEGPTKTILGGLTKVMAGRTEGLVENMTGDEQIRHWKAFNFKNQELSRQDTVPTMKFIVPPSIFTTMGDWLTLQSESHAYLKKWLKETSPEVDLRSLLINIPEELSKSTPHNGMFINPEVSDILSKKVSEHIISIIDNKPIPPEVFEPEPIVEEVIEVKPDATPSEIDIFKEEFIRLSQQAYTMESFAYIANELAKYMTPDSNEITVKKEFLNKALQRIYSNPYILERENVEIDKVPQFVQECIVNPAKGMYIFDQYYINGSEEAKDIIVAKSFMSNFSDFAIANNFIYIPTEASNAHSAPERVANWFHSFRTELIIDIIGASIASLKSKPDDLVNMQITRFSREFAEAHEEVQACQNLVSELLAKKITEFAQIYS